jgi:branched-chain amino acid transport system ATP-binding protein
MTSPVAPAVSMPAMLQTRGLVRRFGGVAAVDHVDLTVAQGEIRAVIGPNGAGKTTLFNLLSGGIAPSAGGVFYRDAPITGLPPHRLARRGIGRTFQINNIFLRATVRDNIRLGVLSREHRIWNLLATSASLYNTEVADIAAGLGLRPLLDVVANTLSYGDRRRLELAIALAGKPDLLLLDEPTCGLSSAERPALVGLIERVVRERGMTALLIEHDMDMVFSIADRVTVLHRGRVLAEGSPAAIAADAAVRQVYLGGYVHA